MDVAPEDLRRDSQGAADGEGSGSGSADAQPGSGPGAGGAPARPLEQEPMLAARIMVEDCMCLILDVLDIDQIFVAAGGERPCARLLPAAALGCRRLPRPCVRGRAARSLLPSSCEQVSRPLAAARGQLRTHW